MGRELRRVPLDFDWPLNKVWEGYLNPHSKLAQKCEACDGSGYSRRAKLFADQWYGYVAFDPREYGARPLEAHDPDVLAVARRNVEHSPEYYGTGQNAVNREALRLWKHWRYQWCHHLIQADVDALVADGRLMDLTRRPRTPEQVEQLKAQEAGGGSGYWLAESNGHHPTAAEVNRWSIVEPIGHDAINRWICIRARCHRDGVFVECPWCEDGSTWPSDEARQLAEGWESSEPPTGDGYQLWETTSEGSPVSPVFATLEALCEHAATHCSTFGTSNFVSAQKWREMLDANFVCHQEGNAVFL